MSGLEQFYSSCRLYNLILIFIVYYAGPVQDLLSRFFLSPVIFLITCDSPFHPSQSAKMTSLGNLKFLLLICVCECVCSCVCSYMGMHILWHCMEARRQLVGVNCPSIMWAPRNHKLEFSGLVTNFWWTILWAPRMIFFKHKLACLFSVQSLHSYRNRLNSLSWHGTLISWPFLSFLPSNHLFNSHYCVPTRHMHLWGPDVFALA